MRVLSLFSGGGLGDYGLELAGMDTVFQCEIQDFQYKLLGLRYPNSVKWRDVITAKEFPSADVLIGGFPCQDISTAKNNAEGINGARSGLWFEQLRIIRTVRPRYAIVENVAGLLVRGMGMVLGGLAESGYDAEWQVLSSTMFGGHHRRLRVYIVAYPTGSRLQRIFPKPKDLKKSIRESSDKMANGGFDESLQPDGRVWPSASRVRRVAYGIADRVHRLKTIGNGQDPRITKWIGKQIMEFERSRPDDAYRKEFPKADERSRPDAKA